MGSVRQRRRLPRVRRYGIALAVLASIGLVAAPAAFAGPPRTTRHNLVSDGIANTGLTDANLVNPWGLAFGPSTPAWVSDNGTDVSTLYSGFAPGNHKVTKVPLTVSIPGGAPTGMVYNGSSSFVVGAGGNSGPANFIFDSEAGKISAWSQNVPPATQARVVASEQGAIFKGLAIAKDNGKERLYATDFHNGHVDVFNGQFQPVAHPGFRDRKLPKRYAPFGIQRIGHHILVTYAKQDANAEDDVSGLHHGYVDVYSTDGKLMKRLISGGRLNSPWGLVKTPENWAHGVSRDLLVGNFGNGHINVYNPRTGKFIDRLCDKRGFTLKLPGLWALKFGNGTIGSPRTLLTTSGPFDEQDGLFAALKPFQ
jgi:uncharacterized protein (TIGR03118 family)